VHEVYKITASIVTCNNPIAEVKLAAQSFLACTLPVHLIVIDNKSKEGYVDRLKECFVAYFIQCEHNKGFGFGHNIGIKNALDCEYYLVLNPDIEIHEGTIEKLVSFMDEHPEVGLISPKILNEDGSIQYLNKRLPTVFDLFARRFLPSFISNVGFIRKRMDYYAMLDKGYEEIQEVPFITGCFMLFRKSVLDKIGGFDENFFMYLEDADITKRVNQTGFKSVYYPYASATHKWARGSHHSIKLTWINIKSAIYYFNKWGWRWI
jgi:GT2 family glycosyltransferase